MRYKKPPPTFFIDEADLETIDYNNDNDEDLFAKESILATANKVFDYDRFKKERAAGLDGMKRQQIDDELFVNESVLAAANKIFDFNKYKKEQASALDQYKQQQLENNLDQAETINYVDDLNLDDVKENKNAKIAAKKIGNEYKQQALKRKQAQEPSANTFEGFKNPTRRRKRSTKSALITARNISKKYKNLGYC